MNLLIKQVESEMKEINNKYHDMALSNQKKGLELLSREQQISFLKEMTEKKLAKEVVKGDERKDIRYLTKQREMDEYFEQLSSEMLQQMKKENIVEDSGYDENIYIITEEYFNKVINSYYN